MGWIQDFRNMEYAICLRELIYADDYSIGRWGADVAASKLLWLCAKRMKQNHFYRDISKLLLLWTSCGVL